MIAPWNANELASWRTRGTAAFAKPAARGKAGGRCLEIRVAPGAKFQYPQFYRDFRAGLAPGDRLSVQVDVRSQDVSQSPGAYLAVEFLKGNQRVGIAHSQTGQGNGAKSWETLRVEAATFPKGATTMRVSLILHAQGTAWFDNVRVERVGRGPQPFTGDRRVVRVQPDDVVLSHFGGVGYHVFYHCHETTPEHLNTVLLKRWREVAPSFARVTHNWSWDEAKMAYVAEQMKEWQRTGTEVYLTTWGPPDCPTDKAREEYAKRVADMLEYFVVKHGCTNLKTFCLTNELSLNGWGKLVHDLPTFRAYHQAFATEFAARGLPVGLLATDASPIANWHTIEWATQHMDGITAVYGGHHYINSYPLDDASFYPWFLDRLIWGAGLARAKGKNFIIGEFGAKQARNTVHGKRNDACIYWGTKQEPFVAIQLAEAVIAGLNAGVYALGHWTFADFPDEYSKTYQNKWGLFKWSGTDYATRPHYYAYGLLTKYLRGPAKVLKVASNDPLVRAAAVARSSDGAPTIVLVNRNATPVRVEVELGAAVPRPFRCYVYDPENPPSHPFGDLPDPDAMLPAAGARLAVELPPTSQVLLTAAYEATPPPAVTGIRTDSAVKATRVSWQPVDASDLCYYRVFRRRETRWDQIGSTIATHLLDPAGRQGDAYRVVAVDCFGNASE
jgi:hypothetical protein